jgi:hypothetical protein
LLRVARLKDEARLFRLVEKLQALVHIDLPSGIVVDGELCHVPKRETGLFRLLTRMAQQPLLLSTDAILNAKDFLLLDHLADLVVGLDRPTLPHRGLHRHDTELVGLDGSHVHANVGQILFEKLAELLVEVFQLKLVHPDDELEGLVQTFVP